MKIQNSYKAELGGAATRTTYAFLPGEGHFGGFPKGVPPGLRD